MNYLIVALIGLITFAIILGTSYGSVSEGVNHVIVLNESLNIHDSIHIDI